MKTIALFSMCAAASVALTACDDLEAAMGMQRIVPDASAVTTNQPLTLPPDYNLRPPRETPKTATEDKATTATGVSESSSGPTVPPAPKLPDTPAPDWSNSTNSPSQ